MLQTASAPYVTSSLHDRGPKLHQSSETLSPLQSTSTYKLSLVGGSAAAAGLGGGAEEHRSYSKHRHLKPHRPQDVKTTEDLPSRPCSRPYDDLSRLVGPLTGVRSPAAPAILDGLYHASSDQAPTPFAGDPTVYRRVMTGAVSPAYRHHHHQHPHSQANMAHGYLPFNANSTAIDQGLFYPTAVVAAALQVSLVPWMCQAFTASHWPIILNTDCSICYRFQWDIEMLIYINSIPNTNVMSYTYCKRC